MAEIGDKIKIMKNPEVGKDIGEKVGTVIGINGQEIVSLNKRYSKFKHCKEIGSFSYERNSYFFEEDNLILQKRERLEGIEYFQLLRNLNKN